MKEINAAFRKAVFCSVICIGVAGLDSCDDKIHHIRSFGQVVARDSCSLDGVQGWVVNIDMAQTVLPNNNTPFPLAADTINRVRYASLIRVYCAISEPDSIIFKKQIRLSMYPALNTCAKSRFKLADYRAFEFGLSK